MRNLLTDVAGVSLGHSTDLALGSGVTVVIFEPPATAAVQIGGGAPGSRDTALLDLDATVQRIDAITLSGGSTFGLDAAGGVQAALREAGRGQVFGGMPIPLAPQAILFDLANGGNKDWGRFAPYREMGYQAALAARPGGFALGSVGAGTGATTPLVKGGLGSASARTASGHVIAALVAVNAVGSPLVGDGPHFWAAPYEQDQEFGGLGLPSSFDLRLRIKGGAPTATTIGLVVTDATLTKAECRRLALMADDGLARAILPAHAPNDGDTVFAAATGEKPGGSLVELGHLAGIVMARAIARGVYEATALPYPGAIRSWKDKYQGE
ncbi:P1 family peptidase [Roseomonas sp. USHLN139]|uniref:P1 family peptidase n=1 Tax=Roseomonas sp. USHLN139 TaxID=3081298 RepID=UPI003B0267FF